MKVNFHFSTASTCFFITWIRIFLPMSASTDRGRDRLNQLPPTLPSGTSRYRGAQCLCAWLYPEKMCSLMGQMAHFCSDHHQQGSTSGSQGVSKAEWGLVAPALEAQGGPRVLLLPGICNVHMSASAPVLQPEARAAWGAVRPGSPENKVLQSLLLGQVCREKKRKAAVPATCSRVSSCHAALRQTFAEENTSPAHIALVQTNKRLRKHKAPQWYWCYYSSGVL